MPRSDPQQKVLDALKTVFDPEIPLNVVDLGLIYDVAFEENTVLIEMTLTAVGCPMAQQIQDAAIAAVEALDEIKSAQVKLVWEPRWSPERITEAGRLELGML